MAIEVALIVTDVPPLITLAAAKSLDYLQPSASRASKAFSLIVADTSPLFTLMLAGALDTPQRSRIAVSIRDAV